MGLLSIFRSRADAGAAGAGTGEPADAVQRARTRARQRLIGAVVLVVTGVVGFPLVFETQPRPVPVDIPIEIPRKDLAPALVMPAARLPAAAGSTSVNPGTVGSVNSGASAPALHVSRTSPSPEATPASRPVLGSSVQSHDDVITESRDEAGRNVGVGVVPGVAVKNAASRIAAAVPSRLAAPMPVHAPVAPRPMEAPVAAPPKPTPPSRAATADGARAKALLEGMDAAPASALRFVIQIGAFADNEAARETRSKVEKLGLRTYTQTAQTPAGARIRVRVGPFATRDEAIKAQGRAHSAGLSAVVLAL